LVKAVGNVGNIIQALTGLDTIITLNGDILIFVTCNFRHSKAFKPVLIKVAAHQSLIHRNL